MDSRELLEVVEGQADGLDQGMDITSGRRIEHFSVQARRQLVVKLYLNGKSANASLVTAVFFFHACLFRNARKAGRERDSSVYVCSVLIADRKDREGPKSHGGHISVPCYSSALSYILKSRT